MREIKFRAWNKLTNQMIYDIQEDKEHHQKIITSFGFMLRQNNYEIMQYTGLKDKNGKEIYEGDIVMFDYEWTKPTETGVITWNNENASFQIKGHIPSSSMKHLDRMKVIGNTYEKGNELCEN